MNISLVRKKEEYDNHQTVSLKIKSEKLYSQNLWDCNSIQHTVRNNSEVVKIAQFQIIITSGVDAELC